METEAAAYNTGVVRICGEDEVNHLCFQGYRLASIIYTDRVEFASENTTAMENGYQQNKLSVSKALVIRVPRFVMVMDRDDALAAQRQTIDELRAQVIELRDVALECERSAKKFEQQVTELESGHKLLKEKVIAQGAENRTIRDTNRKLEEDIAKVRAAVGELKMKEILGA